MIKSYTVVLVTTILFTGNLFSQNSIFQQIVEETKNIEKPLEIQSFSAFKNDSCNQVKLYNKLVNIGVGYINHKNELKKATAIYSTTPITRTHERRINNGEYEHYVVKDSVVVCFVGYFEISNQYKCLLIKIQEVPDEYQKGYFYKLLSFDSIGNHLSTIKVFELINDAVTKDWISPKPTPNVTSVIKTDGSIEITWDEGYNEIYIQHVKLNNEGVFYVEKLEEKVVRD